MAETVSPGSCLCGAVRFRVHGEVAPIQFCHCSQCRKAQGSAFASNVPVATSALEWLAGRELLTEYESSPGKKRAFCSRCGSPVYSRRDAAPEVLRLRVGLLDEPVQARPAAHFCVASKAGWDVIGDDLPQFPGVYVPPPR
jgi:hypothetical protein